MNPKKIESGNSPQNIRSSPKTHLKEALITTRHSLKEALYYNKVSDIEKIDHNLIIEFVNDYCFDAESFSEIFEEIYQVIKTKKKNRIKPYRTTFIKGKGRRVIENINT